MKVDTVISVSWKTWKACASDVQSALLDIYPEGQNYAADQFYCRLDAADPRLAQVLELLRGAGLKPWKRLDSRRQDEFHYAHGRHYVVRDFDAFPILETLGNPNLHDYSAIEQGTLRVESTFFKKKHLLTDGDIGSLLVSADIRAELEAEGFRGMAFREVVPRPVGAKVASAVLGNLSELTSDLRMPPLSKKCVFFDQQGRQVSGSPDEGFIYFEDFFGFPELHYDAESLRDWSWPDFALTHELFQYAPTRHRRRLVVSQRFYQFCKARKLRLDWVAVRIDPD